MGSHPLNLALRFILELFAFSSVGVWAWKSNSGGIKYLLAIGVPLLLMAIWGIFAVPNDPSRSGTAPVVIPGIVRLVIELTIFGFAIWSLYDNNFIQLSVILGIAVLIHYSISYDRISWLLKQ